MPIRRVLILGGILLGLAGCGGSTDRAGGANVVLISIDTLRADRLNCYGYEAHPVSPQIDSLAREGVLFENFITSSPWTTPAHISMLTSLHPSSHGVIQSFAELMKGLRGARFNSLPEARRTLAEALREEGYSTAAFTGGITLDPRIGFGQGFERYDTSMYKLNEANMATMFDWLEAQSSKPFFLFWHTFEVHAPYLHADFLPDEHAEHAPAYAALGQTMNSGESLSGHINNNRQVTEFLKQRGAFNKTVCDALYVGGIRSMDRWVGRLVDELRSRGWYDRTMILLTSDHGEEFADHDPTKFYDAHGHSAYEEMIRIPLIIKLPDQHHAGSRVAAVSGLVDLMPTILDVVGADAPPDRMQGVSLRPLWESPEQSPARVAFSEAAARGKEVKSLRTDRHKYIVEIPPQIVSRHGRSHLPVASGLRMLFDLQRDPLERDNLLVPAPGPAGRAGDLAASFEQRLRGFVAARPGDTEEIELDPETVEKLKALGYVD